MKLVLCSFDFCFGNVYVVVVIIIIIIIIIIRGAPSPGRYF